MATVVKIRKIANPRRNVRRVRMNVARRRNAKRRKMSPKQIRIFGTPAQKAALRRKRRRTNPKVKANRRRRNVAPKRNKRRRNRKNPALVVTLGSMMNPRRRRKKNTRKTNRKRSNSMAATKKNRRRRNVRHNRRRRNPAARRNVRHTNRRRRYNRRRRNPVAHRTNRRRRRNSPKIVVMRPNRRHHHHRRRNRRRNPFNTELFGQPLFGKNSLELIAGGLLGLVAAKFIPATFGSAIPAAIGGTDWGRVAVAGVASVVGGWLAGKVTPTLGQGVLFGGMIQTASIALNAFLPSVYSQLNPSLGRLGTLYGPTQFPVPQNPILQGQAMATLPPAAPMIAANGGGGQVRMAAGVNGIGRAYPAAY